MWMHTFRALLCFVVVSYRLISPKFFRITTLTLGQYDWKWSNPEGYEQTSHMNPLGIEDITTKKNKIYGIGV